MKKGERTVIMQVTSIKQTIELQNLLSSIIDDWNII